MKIFPKDDIEITTELSVAQVQEILSANIQPAKKFTFGFSHYTDEPFTGFIEDNTFEIERVIIGRNSSVPQIKGQIQAAKKGSKIIMQLRLHRFVPAFMTFWLGGVFCGVLGILIGALTQGTNPLFIVFPLLMMMFVIVVVHYGFNSEKEKSIDDLCRILNGNCTLVEK